MRRVFARTCDYCGGPIGDDQPPQAKYCRRSHRQRAFEVRDAAKVKTLKRRVTALRKQVAAYDAALLELAQHPRCGAEIRDALLNAYVPLRDEPGWEQRAWRLTVDPQVGEDEQPSRQSGRRTLSLLRRQLLQATDPPSQVRTPAVRPAPPSATRPASPPHRLSQDQQL